MHVRGNHTRIHEHFHGKNLIVNSRSDKWSDIILPKGIINKNILKSLTVLDYWRSNLLQAILKRYLTIRTWEKLKSFKFFHFK